MLDFLIYMYNESYLILMLEFNLVSVTNYNLLMEEMSKRTFALPLYGKIFLALIHYTLKDTFLTSVDSVPNFKIL